MKEIKSRKPTRLKNFDYASIGSYFITICTYEKRCILATIVGEGSPLPQLTPLGVIIEKNIKAIPEKYKGFSVDHYVIMPNHIHLLISILDVSGREDPSPTINSVIGWLKYISTKEINQMNDDDSKRIFQRSFNDHVIRGDQDYYEISNYILENPLKWHLDKFYANE